jgi:transcriptional regulator with XRE-family HTH domain
MPKYTTLRAAREARGETLTEVSAACGTDAGNLSRIERGEQIPSKELARRLFNHFDQVVELGAIYDPAHSESAA